MKLMNWLSKTIITGVVTAIICMATTWVMVNAYVQQVADKFLGGTVQSVSIIEAVSALTTRETVPVGETDGSSAADQEPSPPSSVEAPVHSDEALPVMGQVEAEEDRMMLSADDLTEKKNSLSSEERMELFSILVTHLPPEQVQAISTLLEGGMTSEEMLKVSAILQAHLSDEDYGKLIEILTKE